MKNGGLRVRLKGCVRQLCHILVRIVGRLNYRIVLHEPERIPGKGSLIVANHVSVLDTLYVLTVLNPILWLKNNPRLVYRKRLDDSSLLARWLMWLWEGIPIESAKDLSKIADALEQGDTVLFFPEGRRAETIGELHRFRPGLGRLLKMTSAKVVPLAISAWQPSIFSLVGKSSGIKLTRNRVDLQFAPALEQATSKEIANVISKMLKPEQEQAGTRPLTARMSSVAKSLIQRSHQSYFRNAVYSLQVLLRAETKRGIESQHYRNGKFHNLEAFHAWTFIDYLIMRLKTRHAKWSDRSNDSFEFDIPEARPNPKSTQFMVVNHATVLIQHQGKNYLTDPIWSKRSSPFSFIGPPKRMVPPGLPFEALPPIDTVLISHNHYDHLDAETILKLESSHKPRYITGLGNAGLLETFNVPADRILEVDWWESVHAGPHEITFVPAQHFSGRGLFDRNRSLWGGFVLSDERASVYFAGDTGLGAFFENIKDRFAPIALAFLSIGAYRPDYFMKDIHMSPADALIAHETLRSKLSVGIHFGTFPLTAEAKDAPAEELSLEMRSRGINPNSFRVPRFGAIYKLVDVIADTINT